MSKVHPENVWEAPIKQCMYYCTQPPTSVSVCTTEYTEWQWPLSSVYSIMMEKIAQPGEGGQGRRHPLALYLPSRTKLWCTLQLRGQIHSPYFYYTPLCTLRFAQCKHVCISSDIYFVIFVGFSPHSVNYLQKIPPKKSYLFVFYFSSAEGLLNQQLLKLPNTQVTFFSNYSIQRKVKVRKQRFFITILPHLSRTAESIRDKTP